MERKIAHRLSSQLTHRFYIGGTALALLFATVAFAADALRLSVQRLKFLWSPRAPRPRVSASWTPTRSSKTGSPIIRISSVYSVSRASIRSTQATSKAWKVAWTMQLGGVEGGGIWTHGGLEGTPIVEDGFMYVTDGWGSVYKIDTHGGKGTLLWKMDPKDDHDWAGAVACCGVDNRGVGLYNDLVISHTLDGRLIATDKETGQVKWQRQVADPDKGEVVTGAPLIVKNMAITGVAGAENMESAGGLPLPISTLRRKCGAPTRFPRRGNPDQKPGAGPTARKPPASGST